MEEAVVKLLAKGEVIIKSFKLNDWTVYVTDQKLIVKKRKEVAEYKYDCISSINLKERTGSLGMFLMGVAWIALTLFLTRWLHSSAFYIFGGFASGLLLMGGGLFLKNNQLVIILSNLVSIKLTGEKAELNSLLKLVREIKEKKQSSLF